MFLCAEKEDKVHSSCPVRLRRWSERRKPLVICLVGPSLLLVLLATAGFIKRSRSRSSSKALVGLPYSRHEMSESSANTEHLQPAAGPAPPHMGPAPPPALGFEQNSSSDKTRRRHGGWGKGKWHGGGSGARIDNLAKKAMQKVAQDTAAKFRKAMSDAMSKTDKPHGLKTKGKQAAGQAAERPPPPAADHPIVIPWRLVATGKAKSLADLPKSVRGNIEHTLKLNPGIIMRYLNDDQCHDYIKEHFDAELAAIYRKEPAGHFRGDICRAAVLLREGGFYTDVDLEAKAPFMEMVDSTTSFMSVFTADGHILNALIATVAGSDAMNGTLREVRRWYKADEGGKPLESHGEGEWMGTVTLRRGMETFLKANCPKVKLEDMRTQQTLQQNCGSHVIRFYQEARLDCWGPPSEECPRERQTSFFDGLNYGIFVPGTRKIVAWPRVSTCTEWWCGGR